MEELVKLRNLSCKCGGKLYRVKKRKSYACKKGHQVYPLKGTIFENTKVPLKSWFYAIFVMTSTRSGVSAKTLQRELGVTYKTAWRMCHKIRSLMEEDTKLEGIIEIDETYVGGKAKNRAKHFFAIPPQKEILFGMVERNGKARVVHAKEYSKIKALEMVSGNVKKNAKIYSDKGNFFNDVWREYDHGIVNHEKNFRVGDIYTANIENFWSHLKRGLTGVYRSVSPKHLQSYANEFAFRYNNRHEPEKMFEKLLGRVAK